MKIRMTFDFSDIERRAIARDSSDGIMATRTVIENWIKVTVNSILESAVEEYEEAGNKVNEAICHLTKTDRLILLNNLLDEREPETKEESKETEPAVEEGS